MRFRKLRMVWSVLCGLACVLLIVLWVRSYWGSDAVQAPISRTQAVSFVSSWGRLGAHLANLVRPGTGWHVSHHSHAEKLKVIERFDREVGNPVTEFTPPRRPVFGQGVDNFYVAHWLAILFFTTLTVLGAPFVKWRFSLRTLLIATTLVAVVLGAIVYAARSVIDDRS